MDIVRFVDSIASSPAVRLDLNDGATWGLRYDGGTDMSPPPLKEAFAGTLLADGELQAAAAYANRRLRLALDLTTAGPDASAAQLRTLWRELNRPTNFLQWQPQGASNPVFFRTLRSSSNAVTDYPGSGGVRTVMADIAAEPFAYGLRVDLASATVYNDAAAVSPALNANPYFETNATNWTASGGSIVRSTAQSHQGVASGLLTPDGVSATVQLRSETVAATAGLRYTISAWVRCAVSRSVTLKFRWNNVSGPGTTVALTGMTWTFVTFSDVAPAGTVDAQWAIDMTGTPPAGNTLHVDEATIGVIGASGANGLYFDLAGNTLLGDVETPLFMRFPAATDLITSGQRTSAVGVRRRGNPAAIPYVRQAETLFPSSGTTLQANDATMSGTGQNFTRTASNFGTPALTGEHPTIAGVDVRGTYRVFCRYRKGTASDTMTLRVQASLDGHVVDGDRVATLPADTNIRWADLGLIHIPLGADPVTDGYSGVPLAADGVNLWLLPERLSGSGYLDIDCLLLCPADDRFGLIKWPEGAGPVAFIADAAAPQIYATGLAGQVHTTEPAELAGALPMVSPGQDTRIFFVLDVGDTSLVGDDKTKTVTIEPYYWPRFLHVRGAA